MSKTSEDLARKTSVTSPGLLNDKSVQFLPHIRGNSTFSQLAGTASLLAIDLISLSVAITLAFFMRLHTLPSVAGIFPKSIPSALASQIWWVLGVCLLCIAYEGLYVSRAPFWRETKYLIKAVTLAFILTFAVVSLGRMSEEISRTVLVLGYLLSIFLLPLGRLIGKRALIHTGLLAQPVLILGAGKTGKIVAQTLLGDKFLGYRIVGFLDDDPEKQAQGVRVNDAFFPVIGRFKDSDRIIVQTGIRHLILAAPGLSAQKMVELVNHLQKRSTSVTVIPDLFGIPVMGIETDHSLDEKMLSFRIRNRLANSWNMIAKRVFDLVVGTIALILTLPLMAIVALLIRFDSRGGVIFSQRRIGREGNVFNCYKFRTMYIDNDKLLFDHLKKNPALKSQWIKYAKIKGSDPRVTRVGRMLRKFSIDELPQVFNVLKGDMSLVGPRPYLPGEQSRLGDYADSILLARPGLTGLWQVSGRNEIDFEGRLRLESWYVRNWSPWLDITLLVRTVGVWLARRGAY